MKLSTKGIPVGLFLVVALCLSASAPASEWIGCANKTHSIDLLVDPTQNQVLGFALFIHGVKQDAISWDIVQGTFNRGAQTLRFSARERSTAPREISLGIQESSGRLSVRGPRLETSQDLACYWGAT